MGESVDFVKALTEAFKDTTVQDVFKSMFNPVMDDLAKDFENKMNVWHKKFVDDMRSEMDALRSNLKMKDDKIKNLEVEIASLKHDQDWLEQYTRRTSLRTSGLPEGNNEDVCTKVLDLCNKKLRIPVEPNEIERVNRLGRPGGSPRQILVKFATYGTRASVFKAKAVLRPGGRHPHAPWTLGDAAGLAQAPDTTEAPSAAEETEDTGTNDDDADNDSDTHTDYSKVFISEDLTRDRQFMFWRARRAEKSKKIRDCWTTDGQIILRDNNNKIIPISTMKDLDEMGMLSDWVPYMEMWLFTVHMSMYVSQNLTLESMYGYSLIYVYGITGF